MLIRIRFNTDKLKFPEQDLPAWRVLYQGQQFFATNVRLNVPCWTTQDEVEAGVEKWHMTCEGRPEWQGSVVTVLPE